MIRRAPARLLLAFLVLSSSSTAAADFTHIFAVTSTADSGPGSLRQAMNDVNAQCTRFDVATSCLIAFKLPPPVPAEGWYTIEPLSPLPVFTAGDVTIDGETQTATTGDSNPRGPEVFLRGDRAGDTDGLTTPGFLAMRGLAIGGFARNAITLSLGRIERNYIGVDPTGSHAVPNGWNGIATAASRGSATVTGNVVSGNGRNGINFETPPVGGFTVTNNRIGVAAQSDDPVPNGASGIFLANSNLLSGEIEGNVIKFNGEFGIGSIGNIGGFRILDNVVARNRQQAIDIGLDGPSTTPVAPPTIRSAVFDAVSGQTVISGVGQITGTVTHYDYRTTVYLYANTAPVSEGERFIGQVGTDGEGRFSIRVNGDLRGLWMTGTTDEVINFQDYIAMRASEFSAPRLVTTPRRRAVGR